MDILAVSVNHKTAPVELREALHLSQDEIKLYLDELKGKIFSEGFIISTCNRTEIYGIPVAGGINYTHLEDFLIQKKPVKNISDDNFQKFFSCSALHHLFKVASGIDSMLVGDNQIFGQVKESFQIAEEKQAAGFLLKRVFDSAARVGKRVKTETTISDGAITVSYAAIQLIEKIFSNFSKKSALVIGTGETGELAAKHLRDKGIGKLVLTNRTTEKATKVAENLHGRVIPYADYKDYLHEFDIIVSATSSPELLISNDDVKKAMKKRGQSAVVYMDIAVPRDISPEIKKIDNVFYYDIDSLNIIVDQNLKKRRDEIPKARQIIMEELVSFYSWFNSLEIAPTIKSLRDHFEEIRADEVKNQINKFSDEDREKLEIITKRIINKILHQPSVQLRKVAEQGVNSPEAMAKIALVRDLFGIEEKDKK